MSQERFISELLERYPEGSVQLENEIKAVKRKLDDTDFSDIDENEYCAFADSVEKKFKSETREIKLHGNYKCSDCGREYYRKSTYTRHVLTHTAYYQCHLCPKKFKRIDVLRRHQKKTHGQHGEEIKSQLHCQQCHTAFDEYQNLFQHVTQNHPSDNVQKGGNIPQLEISLNHSDNTTNKENFLPEGQRPSKKKTSIHNQEEKRALNNTIQDRVIHPRNEEKKDLLTFMANSEDEIIDFLQSRLGKNGIKWYLSIRIELVKEDGDGNVTATSTPHFRSFTYATLNLNTFSQHELNEAFHKIFESLEAYLHETSGWIFQKVISLQIHTVDYLPLNGSSYMPLPNTLKKSNSILNIENRDQKCFLYCVLASLHPTESQPELVSHYQKYEQELNMKNIAYPVSLHQIDKFESQNQHVSVNVFTMEEREIIPLKITGHNGRHHVNLLLLQNEYGSHYCLITNINRFLSRIKTDGHEYFVCNTCLHMFTKQSLLTEHTPYCSSKGPQRVNLPEEKNAFIEFKDFEKTLPVPFIIYCDFETLNRKVATCQNNPKHSGTTSTAHLTPCSFGYKVVSIDPQFTKPTVIYRGHDASKKLIEFLLKEKEEIEAHLSKIKPLVMTKSDYDKFYKSNDCYICKKSFAPGQQKARHHGHFTGEFYGPAHMDCNLQCKQAKFIPVVFHNLKNFDAHLLCQSIGMFKENDIKCIPQNMERYISFSLDSLRFIDSAQFLPCSLEVLVESLTTDGSDSFHHLRQEFPSSKKFELLLRKGIYPYDYMDHESKFDEITLPPQEMFYSTIKREHVSDEDYKHAENVFKTFAFKNLGQYHDLYLQSDVLLLSDVFEKFRKVSQEQYGLDPAHFYTSPGLSWQALLKKTDVHLELLTDIDMLLFIEKGIRGGISQISNRYNRPNNKFMDDYKPNEKNSFLSYIDANNLYGWAMSQPLPTGNFRFLEQNEIKNLIIPEIPVEGSKGYIFEVSLGYPESRHIEHNCLPLAPERRTIQNDELSPYARRVWKKLHGKSETDDLPPRAKVEKLVCSLNDKHKYVLHYRNLQLYLSLGMQLKEVHRVLEFQQSPWMKQYIEFNTEMRKRAKSTFDRNFYKLLNNAVFGKTMENLRKHKDVHLCHRRKRLIKLSAKPTYKNHRIFSEDLVAVEMLKARVTLNRPLYVGMCILDLSKHLMYDFFYNHLKRIYPGDKLQLQMTDTDSFLFSCATNDIHEDMKKNIHFYDTSDFPKEHDLFSNENKKVLGKFKSETNEKFISEFTGLRSKMYAFSCEKKEEKRAKGISKITVQKDLRLNDYKQALFQESEINSSMSVIRSNSHEIYCQNIIKTGLSCFDDKRYLLDDGISSLAYGHFKIKQMQ